MDGRVPLSSNTVFSLLGPVRLRKGSVELSAGQPRQCAVATSLLLRGGTPASMSALVDDVWGDDPPSSALGSIRTYVYRLRRTLHSVDAGHIRLSEGGYSLHVDPDALDVNRFEGILARARAAQVAGDPARGSAYYAEGLALWRGAALAGVPGPYADVQRTRLEELRLASIEGRLTCDLERGLYADTAADLTALVAEHPLRERFSELLMIALYGSGRQAEALGVYHTISHALRENLGVSPSTELRKAHELILREELTLPRPRVALSPSAPLDQLPAELPHFVGRDAEFERVRQLVDSDNRTSSALTVVVGGMAGGGKTAFAIRLAHRLADRFPDGQLFADLHGFGPGQAREPADVLADFLRALGVAADQIPAGAPGRAVMFRGILAERRIAVVLDNVGSSEQARDLLPGKGASMAIVTSRHELPGLLVTHQATPITLGPLSTQESERFLTGLFGARAAAEPSAIADIAGLCEGLPLALSVVGARASYRPTTPVAYLAADIRSRRRPLDAFACEDDHSLDVRAALSWSVRTLSPDCARFLYALSGRPGDDLTAENVAAMLRWPVSTVEVALSRLVRVHLLRESEPGHYAMSGLVRAYAAELFQPEAAPSQADGLSHPVLERHGTTS